MTVGGSLEEVAFAAGLRRRPCDPLGAPLPSLDGELIGGGGASPAARAPELTARPRGAPPPPLLGDFTN